MTAGAFPWTSTVTISMTALTSLTSRNAIPVHWSTLLVRISTLFCADTLAEVVLPVFFVSNHVIQNNHFYNGLRTTFSLLVTGNLAQTYQGDIVVNTLTFKNNFMILYIHYT